MKNLILALAILTLLFALAPAARAEGQFHGSDYLSQLLTLQDAVTSAINEANRAQTLDMCVESPTPEDVQVVIDEMTAALAGLVAHLQDGKPCDPE